MLNNSNDGYDWREHNVAADQVYRRHQKTRLGSKELYEVTDRILQDNIKKGNIKS